MTPFEVCFFGESSDAEYETGVMPIDKTSKIVKTGKILAVFPLCIDFDLSKAYLGIKQGNFSVVFQHGGIVTS